MTSSTVTIEMLRVGSSVCSDQGDVLRHQWSENHLISALPVQLGCLHASTFRSSDPRTAVTASPLQQGFMPMDKFQLLGPRSGPISTETPPNLWWLENLCCVFRHHWTRHPPVIRNLGAAFVSIPLR